MTVRSTSNSHLLIAVMVHRTRSSSSAKGLRHFLDDEQQRASLQGEAAPLLAKLAPHPPPMLGAEQQ